MFKFTIIAVILFITTAVNCIATVISWQRQKSQGGLYFAIGMLGVTFWTLAGGFDYATTAISTKVFFAKLEYLGYNVALVFFALFAISYAGYEKPFKAKRFKILLGIIPFSNILLAWTNDWHGWLWSGFVRSEFGDNTVIFERGPAFLWVSASGYLLIMIVILALWLAMHRGSKFSRYQARLLFFASLLPLIGNLIYLFQPEEFSGVDWSSILFSASSLLFLWALYGRRLLDLVPIAHEKLIDSLSDGMIVLDPQGRMVDINGPAARTLNSQPERLIGKKLDKFVPSAKNLLEQPLEQEIRTEFEFGIGEKCYFDVLISPLYENQKTIIGHLIFFHDVTTRKQNELRLLQLNRAVEQSPTSVVITDLNGAITYVNPQFTTLTGYAFEEAIGKNPRILQLGQTPAVVYQELWRTIKSGGVWRGEFLNKKKSGELYWEDATIAPVLDRNGQLINFIAVKMDITERKRAEEALQELAATDPLTGLFNRRHFFEIAEKEFAKSMRYDRLLSVILFDIDLFKIINDTFGHLVGDQVLVQIGKLLRENGRDTDLAARYGGEEFIILLLETDCADAKIVAERIRQLVEDSPVRDEKGIVHFTASFGIAGKNKTQSTLDQMIEKADQALYEAKRAGRNRVVCRD